MRSNLVEAAAIFAAEKHKNQQRKYTGEPYFNHLAEVATFLEKVGLSEATIAAGYLHDVIEDQGVTVEQLTTEFGVLVAQLVSEVTDVSKPTDGNRRIRKTLDREHLAKASPAGKSIKLADIISNTTSIRQHDAKFAVVYLEEKRALLPLLTEGNPELYSRAWKVVYE